VNDWLHAWACRASWLERWNLKSQFLHLNSLRLRCLRSWSLRFPFVINAFPQNLQLKGFSPVWIRIWCIKLVLCLRIFLQVLYGHWLGKQFSVNSSWSTSLSALEIGMSCLPLSASTCEPSSRSELFDCKPIRSYYFTPGYIFIWLTLSWERWSIIGLTYSGYPCLGVEQSSPSWWTDLMCSSKPQMLSLLNSHSLQMLISGIWGSDSCREFNLVYIKSSFTPELAAARNGSLIGCYPDPATLGWGRRTVGFVMYATSILAAESYLRLIILAWSELCFSLVFCVVFFILIKKLLL